MIYNHTVGTTVHFGPHELLPPNYLHLLFRLLSCNNCYFRELYHQLSVEEMHEINRALKVRRKSQNLPFHSLSRAIKVVLRSLQLGGKDFKSFVIQARSKASVSIQSHSNNRLNAIMHTALLVREKFLVCPIHGHELLNILYYLGDEDNEVMSYSSQLNSLIPRGRSEFFRSVTLEDEYVLNDKCCEGKVQSNFVFAEKTGGVLKMNLYECGDDMFYTGLTGFCDNSTVSDANRRWKSSYDCECTELRQFSPCPKICSIDSDLRKRHVHFPDDNPVSSVHILRTYATACQLERRDHTWLFEARRSFLEQNPFSSDIESDVGQNNCEQQSVPAVATGLSTSNTTFDILNLENTDNDLITKSKPKRKKRRRRRGALKLLYCASTPQIQVDCDIKLMYLADPGPQSCTVFVSGPSN